MGYVKGVVEMLLVYRWPTKMNFALKKPMEPNGPQNYSSVEAYFAIGKSPILLYCLDHFVLVLLKH